jgi:predicted  nucleic acid-binding Zn-ribbon protein
MKAAQMAAMEHGTGDVWRVGCDIERELNAANVELEEKRKDVVWLATEKAKSENYVTELENRLRALWDKLEGERKYYMEHLQLNEELVSEIELENERLKEQNKRQNEAIDSLREMYAKDGKL